MWNTELELKSLRWAIIEFYNPIKLQRPSNDAIIQQQNLLIFFIIPALNALHHSFKSIITTSDNLETNKTLTKNNVNNKVNQQSNIISWTQDFRENKCNQELNDYNSVTLSFDTIKASISVMHTNFKSQIHQHKEHLSSSTNQQTTFITSSIFPD